MAICLVTGGAGFIGSHLVNGLVARGHEVRVLDNFSTGPPENLARIADKIELTNADLADLQAVREATRGADFVFHMARPAHPPLVEADPLATRLSSAIGTLHVLIAARDAQVRRVVYASCAAVYGSTLALPLRENDQAQPLSPYAAATLAGEQDCVVFTYVYGLETVRLRYTNVFGPWQVAGPHREVASILQEMRAGRNPVLYGDGAEPQDFVYVGDAVYAALLAAEAPRVAGRVYNIGRGRPATSLEVVDTVNALLGTRLQPTYARSRPGEDVHNLVDISNAQVDLGYCPSTDLEQGLRWSLAHLTTEQGGHGAWAKASRAASQGPHPSGLGQAVPPVSVGDGPAAG